MSTPPPCNECGKRPAAREGAQNRTPPGRQKAIAAGICNPCMEWVRNAVFLINTGTTLTTTERTNLQGRIDRYNQWATENRTPTP